MNLRLVSIVLGAVAIGAVVGILGFVWIVGGSGQPSAPISAPTLDVNALPTLNPTQAFEAVTEVAQLRQTVANLEATLQGAQAAQAQPTTLPTEAAAVVGNPASTRALYRIDPASSTVTFHLQEDLRGVRTEVIGTTSEVAGDIVLDAGNPAASQLGTIRINARTLATDSEFRNRALRSQILKSANDQYEFIEFVPTAINGLPATIEVGQTYAFEVVGNLTLVGQTQPVTFTAQAVLASPTSLTGTATTTVTYANWGLSIPNAPGVANVTPDVTLSINFTANQVQQ